MMFERNYILVIVGTAVLGMFSLLSLGAVIGLGIGGILEAQNLNRCEGNNVAEECVDETPLETSINASGAGPTSTVAPDVSRDFDWIYYLTGSTAVSVVWAFVTVFAMLLLVEALRDKQKKTLKELKEKKSEGIEMGRMGGGGGGGEGASGSGGGVEDAGVRRKRTSGVDEPDKTKEQMEGIKEKLVRDGGMPRERLPGYEEHDHYELQKDYIGAYRVREWHGKPLRHLGFGGSVAFFFCLLALILSLECLLWAVALGYYHTRRLEKNIFSFVLVEFLAGFLLPLLLFVSSVLLAIILDFVTIGRVDVRKRIKHFLPSVDFEEGKEFDYWVIEDRFYFKLEKKDEHLKKHHGLWYSCDKTLSTWLLTGITALTILFCLAYFVDITVIEEKTMSSCPEDDGLYDCFNRSTFDFVDCADDNVTRHVELVHCFRFLKFGVDTNPISDIALTYTFYFVIVTMFSHVFSVVKTLLHLHRTRLWGVAFLVVGVVGFFVTIIFLAVEDEFQIQANFLNVMQVFMACLFIILVGVLVVRGVWYEKIFDKKKVKPIAELLLRYDQISNAEVQQIEHSYAVQIKKEDPTSQHVVEGTF